MGDIMLRTFSAGDTVVCVDSEHCLDLKTGISYKIKEVTNNGLKLEGLDFHLFDPIRFVHTKDLTKESAPAQGGIKHDSNKPRTELIPTEFMIEVAKALTFGANKYHEDNFKKGLSYRRLLGAAKRHIELELCAIDEDRESGLSHLAHAGASLAMYSFMKEHRKDLDDRYKYSDEEKARIEAMMYGDKK